MWALRPQNNNQHLNKMVHAERDQQNFVHLYMEYVKLFSEGMKTGDLTLVFVQNRGI